MHYFFDLSFLMTLNTVLHFLLFGGFAHYIEVFTLSVLSFFFHRIPWLKFICISLLPDKNYLNMPPDILLLRNVFQEIFFLLKLNRGLKDFVTNIILQHFFFRVILLSSYTLIYEYYFRTGNPMKRH